MNKISKIFILFILIFCIFALGACFKNPGLTYYLVSPVERADSYKKFGCEEYLIPITKSTFGTPTVEEALNALFAADPAKDGENLMTASAITSKVLFLDSVEERAEGAQKKYIVSFRMNDKAGFAGVCDTPRLQEQVAETIRAASNFSSFVIRLDGSTKKWGCLGDESGLCDNGEKDAGVDVIIE